MTPRTVIAGERVTMPCRTLSKNKKATGWVTTEAAETGVVIALNAQEKNDAGIFISLKELRSFIKEIKIKKRAKLG